MVACAGTTSAVVAMTRAMAVEMKDAGIRVNSISPGGVRTWVRQNLIDSGAIVAEATYQDLLIKCFASCEEVAELVVWLCGERATYVKGVNWISGYMAD